MLNQSSVFAQIAVNASHLLGENETQGIINSQFVDLDGDGDEDFVFMTFLEIKWLQNNGEGTYVNTQTIVKSEGSLLKSLAVGDIDFDGDVDIVWVQLTSARISETFYLENNGAGDFQNSYAIQNSDRASSIDAIDFFPSKLNSDENLHFLVNESDKTHLVSAQLNEGVFEIDTLYTKENDYRLGSWKQAELNDDDYPEFILYNYWRGQGVLAIVSRSEDQDYVSILNLEFEEGAVRDVVTMDVDNDMDTDLIVALAPVSLQPDGADSLDYIVMLENSGNNVFEEPVLLYAMPHLYDPDPSSLFSIKNSLVPFDVDEDGFQDLMLSSVTNGWKTGQFSWLKNLGDYTFSAPEHIRNTFSNYDHIYLHDVDGDSLRDIVAHSGRTGSIDWFQLSDAPEQLFKKTSIKKPTIFSPKDIAVAQVYGSQNDVFVATGSSLGSILYYKNRGEFNFDAPIVLDSTQAIRIEMLIYDWNRDGRKDLITFTQNNRTYDYDHRVYQNEISWFENNTDGSFGEKTSIKTFTSKYAQVYWNLGDTDGDGDKDLVLLYNPGLIEYPYLYVISNRMVDQNGQDQDFIYLTNVSKFDLINMDNDEPHEMVVVYPWIVSEGRRTLSYNTRIQVFDLHDLSTSPVVEEEDAQFTLTIPNGTTRFDEVNYTYADLDNNGEIDFILGQTYDMVRLPDDDSYQKIQVVFRESVDNEFEVVMVDSLHASIANVTLADIDADGLQDIVATAEEYISIDLGYTQNIIWYKNLGDRRFVKQEWIGQKMYQTGKLLSRDLNKDGANELLAINEYTGNVTIYDGTTLQTLTNSEATFEDTPHEVSLTQNFPNPFNPSTVISYQLPVSSTVRLSVFDILGREVAVLVDERMTAGDHQINFDGARLASGVYLYRLEVGNQVQTRKMVLIK